MKKNKRDKMKKVKISNRENWFKRYKNRSDIIGLQLLSGLGEIFQNDIDVSKDDLKEFKEHGEEIIINLLELFEESHGSIYFELFKEESEKNTLEFFNQFNEVDPLTDKFSIDKYIPIGGEVLGKYAHHESGCYWIEMKKDNKYWKIDISDEFEEWNKNRKF